MIGYCYQPGSNKRVNIYGSIIRPGIEWELDFILDQRGSNFTDVEMEVDIVFRLRNLPKWVKGVRIYGVENSDIELI